MLRVPSCWAVDTHGTRTVLLVFLCVFALVHIVLGVDTYDSIVMSASESG